MLVAAAAVVKIKDDVVAGKRPATRLFLPDVPDYVKEMTSLCWTQEAHERPAFNGKDGVTTLLPKHKLNKLRLIAQSLKGPLTIVTR